MSLLSFVLDLFCSLPVLPETSDCFHLSHYSTVSVRFLGRRVSGFSASERVYTITGRTAIAGNTPMRMQISISPKTLMLPSKSAFTFSLTVITGLFDMI